MNSYHPQIDNPYPDAEWSDIDDFCYLTPLILQREIEAVRTRENKNKDAKYIVAADYKVTYNLDGQERTIVVPRGMLTDLASVPSIAGLVSIGRVGPHLEAAIVHDFLYIAWQYLNPPREAKTEDRQFADRLFRAGMERASVQPIKREIIYRAVRWFGSRTYKSENPCAFIDLDTACIGEDLNNQACIGDTVGE